MIDLHDLAVRNGSFSLRGIQMHLPAGRYGVLMGKTGCGKTTLLEAVCGLKPVESGRIALEGRDMTRAKPGQRGIGYVPQDGALFTTLSIRENLAFALELRRWSSKAITERVEELADLLHIGDLLQRRPEGLSGGETQRVALGRALAARPHILCLDEPLSALDHDTRLELCALLAQVQQQLGMTVLHVTHNRDEAERLAQHLFRFEDGVLSEVAR
jgi:molybdate/tungstate transport system ATP-binding protein